jgi:glycoside/pentoside/hexuronide:cation symporter, GPH family
MGATPRRKTTLVYFGGNRKKSRDGSAEMTSQSESALPVSLKLSWATGAFGVAVLMNGISALMLFYLTNVVQLNAGVAGFIIFLSKIYDAVSDPVSGHLSDRTTSTQGRRRPWLFWGAFVSAISFILVFTIPFTGPYDSVTSGDGLMTCLYVLVMLILYTTGYSMFNVPYMAMPAEMTNGYHERSSIHGYRVVVASLGGFLVQSMGGVILQKMGKDWDAHATLGVAGAAIILITMLVAWWGTRNAPQLPRTEQSLGFGEQIQGFLNNRPFQQVLAVKLVQLIGVAASSGGLMFFLVNVIDKPLTVLPLIGGPMILAVFLTTPLLIRFSKVVGKRGGYMLSAVVTGVAALSWVLAQPGEPLWALALRGFLTGIAFAGNVLFAMSMLTDAMEIDSHRTGMRREGMYSALYSFVEKLAAAIGPLILGGALAMAGYDPKVPPKEVTEEVRQAVLLGIAYVPAAMAVLACAILAFYRLDEAALADERSRSKLPQPAPAE